jgi:hypothetical protein
MSDGSTHVTNNTVQRDAGAPDRFVGEKDLVWQNNSLATLSERWNDDKSTPQDIADLTNRIEGNWQNLSEHVSAGEIDLKNTLERAVSHHYAGQIEELGNMVKNYATLKVCDQ